MLPRHVPILKAKKGEFQALQKTTTEIARKILPLFELGRITDSIRERRYMIESSTPTITYLGRMIEGIAKSWGKRPAMVDGYQWAADAQTEDGSHVIAYVTSALRQLGMPVIPVVGYDRWENETYQLGLQGIEPPSDGHYCLRLDSTAIEDSAEPVFFEEHISSIISGLNLDPGACSVLIDFGDASNISIDALVTKATAVIQQLMALGFHHYITAGCSIPKTIDLAVKTHDTSGMLLRKEMLLWQTLKASLKGAVILYGDYCVRGPTTNDDVRSAHTNGKIRHTVNRQTFVVRGHPFSDDHSAEQMYDLSAEVVSSRHYLGAAFSWGDAQIKLCERRGVMGGPTEWIAIDTNHHLAFVVQEVEEFERNRVVVAERTN